MLYDGLPGDVRDGEHGVEDVTGKEDTARVAVAVAVAAMPACFTAPETQPVHRGRTDQEVKRRDETPAAARTAGRALAHSARAAITVWVSRGTGSPRTRCSGRHLGTATGDGERVSRGQVTPLAAAGPRPEALLAAPSWGSAF